MKKYYQTNIPSRLANLNGQRKPGSQITLIKGIKPPKRRFNIGDSFEYDKTIWSIIYIYRLVENPHEWCHCLEETKTLHDDAVILSDGFEALGAGATTSRIVYEMFRNWSDANMYFNDIYKNGSQTTKTTQELLKLRKI